MGSIGKVFCPNCGTAFEIDLLSWSAISATCSAGCHANFRAKLTSVDLRPLKASTSRQLRIAELDYIEELDSLIERLQNIPDLSVDRYRVPGYIFRGHPPGAALEFPIATLDCDGERVFRESGVAAVSKILSSLNSTSAPTRKMKRPKWDHIKSKGSLLLKGVD